MADPPPLRLALPPDLLFEAPATPPAPPTPTVDAPPVAPFDAGLDPMSAEDPARRPLGEAFDHLADESAHEIEIDGEVEVVDEATSTGRRVRPYTITGGRTAVTGLEIPLEAQVLTSNHRPVDPSQYRWETARLVAMLDVPMALVEVAARLEVPVGVARVLVADLVDEGVLIIHLPPPSSSFTSLLEQVLDGVRKL